MVRSKSPDRDGDSVGSQEAHDTYPSFSEYAHVAAHSAIGELTFAVGLRSENPEEIVRRMLPLCVVKERPVVEKGTKKPKTKAEVKICQRPECVQRREKLLSLNSENDALRGQMKVIESKLAASQNKIALTEKTMGLNEEKIDSLKGQIEDTTSRIFTAEAEVEKLDEGNQELRDALKALEDEIESLRTRTEETTEETQVVVDQLTSGDKVVFAPKRKNAPLSEFAAEVKTLSQRFSSNQPDDDDSD